MRHHKISWMPSLRVGRLFGKITTAVLIVVLICSWGVIAGRTQRLPKRVPKCFLTGNEYLQLKPELRFAYVMGLYDGMQLSTIFGAKDDRFYDYIEGMNSRQIVAIVEKYLKDNPQEWHKPMNYIFFFALRPPKLP